MGLFASLRNTCSNKLEQSSPVKSGSGILTKLHEKLAATRSSPSPLSNLDVPKLRELKSHSFPPPFSASEKAGSAVNVVNVNHHHVESAGSSTMIQVQNTNGCCRHPMGSSTAANYANYNNAAEMMTITNPSQIINSSSGGSAGESTSSSTSVLPGNYYEDTFGLSAAAEPVETTDERRKRWLMYNHTSLLENIG